MEKMKCPHCKKEIEIEYGESTVIGPFFRHLFLSLLVFVAVSQYIPIDIEHGYSANWNLVIALVASIIFTLCMWLYRRNKTRRHKEWKQK